MSSNIPAAPPVKKAGERTMSPDELDRLATQLMDSGFIETAADLRIAAHAWRQDIAKQVSGFFEDEAPTYQQGAPTHELQHLITAEDCIDIFRRGGGLDLGDGLLCLELVRLRRERPT